MKHLYQKIYLTIIASLLVVVLVSSTYWRFTSERPRFDEVYEFASELIIKALPAKDNPIALQRKAVSRIAKRLKLDLTLFDENSNVIASYGRTLPVPPQRINKAGRMRGHIWVIRLPDGRIMSARPTHRPPHHSLRLIGFLSLIALVVGLCAYPVVRGLTRRLELLQQGVETLGAGDLSTRVPVRGRDEVSKLATSFNLAAERIESLLKAHQQFLANASHELRTPLSRVRIGIEFLKDKAEPKRKAELENDIAELDGLIDEILLASRLDILEELEVSEDVDFLALVAEECARYKNCELEGHPVSVRGDPRLLRRMIRNLLDNAYKHGKMPVSAKVGVHDTKCYLFVIDSGEGWGENYTEDIFAPFYRSQQKSSKTSGTGLGLYLVKQISERHGGKVKIASRAYYKSAIHVELPRLTML